MRRCCGQSFSKADRLDISWQSIEVTVAWGILLLWDSIPDVSGLLRQMGQ
jgi:hypothetical protein